MVYMIPWGQTDPNSNFMELMYYFDFDNEV